MVTKIHGMLTALITPFKNNKIDENAYEKLIEHQIKNGIHGLVPCGSTGEFATLEEEEILQTIKLCVEVVNKRVPVIAGIGTNNTVKTVNFAQIVSKLGVDAVMAVVPYYNKPSQKGLYEHYKLIHDAINIGLVLYNVPGRTVTDLLPATTAQLAKLPRIIALKDATANLERPLQILSQLQHTDFTLLSGDDVTFLAHNINGGHGSISVASNVVPKQMVQIQNLCQQGKYNQALELHTKLLPLYDVLFCESNPVPVKYALELMGVCSSAVRLPLWELSDINKEKIRNVLKKLELI
jgi:4-hydroxy-tetrahydrodipicolinate synthase